MGKISNLLWGAAIGAGMMYFMDPEQGNRRKALVRDQVYKLRSMSDEALETAVNDLRNRMRGILAEGMSMLSNEARPEKGLNVSQSQEEGKMPASGQWSPSTRLIAGTGAGYLLLYSAVRGGFIGFVARLGGLFLGARALTNMNARQLTGRGIEQGIIEVRKTILEKGRTRAGGQKVTREEIAGTGTSTGKQPGQKQQEKAANTSAVLVAGSHDDEASQTTVHSRTKDDSPMSGEENSPGGQNRH